MDSSATRLQLVQVDEHLKRLRLAVALRAAHVEQELAIVRGGDKNVGANERERERVQLITKEGDHEYTRLRDEMLQAEHARATLAAQLEVAADEQRELDRASRTLLAQALLMLAGVRSADVAALNIAGDKTAERELGRYRDAAGEWKPVQRNTVNEPQQGRR